MSDKPRLTRPQQDLLDELRETGGLYIKRYSRWYRTIEALREKGLVHITEHDHSRQGQDRWEAIE